MAKKFIINDGDLITGHVEFHEDLVCKGRDRKKTVGGGYWHYDILTKTMYFYGSSTDFGRVTKEQLRASFKSPSIENANIVYSEKEYLSDVMKEFQEKVKPSEDSHV